MNILTLIKRITTSGKEYPEQLMSTDTCKLYTCINPYSYHIVRKNPQLYSNFDSIFVDGISMCWWIRILWGRKIPRLSFDMSGIAIDLFKKLNCKNNNESIYFIGSNKQNIDATIKNINDEYPKINIQGYRNGYFKNETDRKTSLTNIIALNPNFVIVGMGSPLQEKFAVDLKALGYQGSVFTCCGFLHQTSSKIKYYPDWIDKLNLRAFYRLYKEKGLFKRLYNVLIEFPILFLYDTITTKISFR